MAAKKAITEKDGRMAWWREARFGMFIHWGLYAIPAGVWKGKEIPSIGEWIMFRAQIPVAEYAKLAERFNPVDFDAKAWVALAKRAGMKYLTITSKHHDGFALFKSAASPYNIVDTTPFKRDPIAELARECKKAGIRLCFYYSQKQDWHHPDGSGNAWDYDPKKQDFDRYMEEKALPQVREILTQYGPIGMIWYDTPMDITQAQTKKFVDMVRKVQPDCIVNGRAGHGIGDYVSMGDNMIPPARVDGDWETPATLNDTWGYKKNDQNWKPVKGLIRRLVDIVSKGGNYLLNVGPTARGVIPAPSVKRLEQMGDWMKVNGEAVYGASASPHPFEMSWGSLTCKPGRLYLNIVDWPQGEFVLYGLKNRVKKAYLLADKKKPLAVSQAYREEIDLHTLTIGLPKKVPDRAVSVVVLEVEGELEMDQMLLQNADGRVMLEAYNAELHQAVGASAFVRGRWGTVENWANKKNRVEWTFKVAQPGAFEVVVLSQTERDGRWVGGHRLKVSVGKRSVIGVVQEQERVENSRADSYLKDVISPLGKIVLSRPGEHCLTLRVDRIAKKKPGFKLRAVYLVPVG
ncbi:MAG: alpha-L-fucosidase [bacterium]|nr:alpha-L-fucosidase [bacterium]